MTTLAAVPLIFDEQEICPEDYQRRIARLSRREAQVLGLIASGLMNKHVALELGISPVTVQIHRRQVMRKMQVKSFAELVRIATILQLFRSGHRFSA